MGKIIKNWFDKMSKDKIDFKDLWENWPYYAYDISAKSDPQ